MEEAAEERVLDLPDPDETSLVGSGFAIWYYTDPVNRLSVETIN